MLCYGTFTGKTAQNFIFYPYSFFIMPSQQNRDKLNLKQEKQEIQFIKINNSQQMGNFQQQIHRKHKQSKLKFWTQQDDEFLLDMVRQKKKWQQIALNLSGKNVMVCKRRYKRLLKLNEKWPKQNQALIKHLYEVQKLTWGQIQKQLPKYTKKQIKERYKNFLEVEVKRALWTLEQDLQLRRLVQKYGNNWVRFTKLFQGRSQLQLKNRYNKFIKPAQQKLSAKTNHQKSSSFESM